MLYICETLYSNTLPYAHSNPKIYQKVSKGTIGFIHIRALPVYISILLRTIYGSLRPTVHYSIATPILPQAEDCISLWQFDNNTTISKHYSSSPGYASITSLQTRAAYHTGESTMNKPQKAAC